MRGRWFYTFSRWYGWSDKGLFPFIGDIWCSILVYHYLFAVCALLVSLVVCCAACLLIMRYRANNSPFLLLLVHIRQRAFSTCPYWKVLFPPVWQWSNSPLAVMVLYLHLLVRRLFPFCCTFFYLVVCGAALPYWSNKTWFLVVLVVFIIR